MGVAIRRFHFKDPVTKLQDGYVMGATAAIKYSNFLIHVFFVDTKSQCRSCWFVDDASNLEASNLTSFLGCLTLCVIEVGWHSDHCFINACTKVIFSCFLHLLKNHG